MTSDSRKGVGGVERRKGEAGSGEGFREGPESVSTTAGTESEEFSMALMSFESRIDWTSECLSLALGCPTASGAEFMFVV